MGTTHSHLYTLCKQNKLEKLKENAPNITYDFFKYHDADNTTPLSVACQLQNEAMAIFLLETLVKEANKNKQPANGFNSFDNDDILKILNTKTNNGTSLIGFSIFCTLPTFADKLIEYDIDVTDVYDPHHTALSLAMIYRQWELAIKLVNRFEYLINAPCIKDSKMSHLDQLTTLSYPTEQDQKNALPLLDLLITKTKEIEGSQFDGGQALYYACTYKKDIFAFKLLESGANCNYVQEQSGYSCLAEACSSIHGKSKELAIKLIEYGADVNHISNNRSIFDDICNNGWHDVAKMILDRGIQINLRQAHIDMARVVNTVLQYKPPAPSSQFQTGGFVL